MTYREWEVSVSESIQGDPLWTVEAYRLALFAWELFWRDRDRLKREKLYDLLDQMARATGGISAQIAEGYSRGTGKDRARFYEYALGSGRESRDGYFKSRHLFGPEVTENRLQLHTRIIRLLMTMVPQQRSECVQEPLAEYGQNPQEALLNQEVPF